MTRGIIIFALLGVTACGASRTPEDAGGGDATVLPDAPASDGGSAVVDRDGDGLASDVDCDDDDRSIGAAGTRPCSNECGAGSEVCTDGRWSECSAPTDCRCSTPGEMQVRPCGNCGTASATCTDGRWQPMSACFGEGECAAAAVEMRTTMYCGTQQRLCSATCAWSDWLRLEPDGECRAGAYRVCPGNLGRENFCGDDCQWEEECR